MTEICVIRHGQTDWNADRRYQGVSDIPLNETGKSQAALTADQLAQMGKKFSAVYSSPLKRAFETGKIVSTRLDLPIHSDPRLQEVCLGDWEGMKLVDVEQSMPEMSWKWFNRPLDARIPGNSEPVVDVVKRVTLALDEIARRHPDEAVIVTTHGFVTAVIRAVEAKIDLNDLFTFLPKNAEAVLVNWTLDRQPDLV